MKVGVIGAGSMGGMHARLLGEMDGVEVLVVDADPHRAEATATAAGGRAATHDEAIAEADAIVVATPPELHAASVLAAIDAGRSVLCEKPLTDTLVTSRALTARAEATGAHVEVGFQRRHDTGFLAAREAIGGQLHLVHLTALDPLVAPRDPLSVPASEVAPIFRDSSVHDFDFVRWVSGQEVTEVTATGSRRDGGRPDDPRGIESAVVTMRLASGTLAVLEASWLHPSGYDIRVELVSEAAAVTAGLSPRTPARHLDWPQEATDAWAGYLERFEPAYRAELVAFLAAARREAEPASTARDGLEAMRIAVAATRSFTRRRTVAMTEV